MRMAVEPQGCIFPACATRHEVASDDVAAGAAE
jgi:hypothetical protein